MDLRLKKSHVTFEGKTQFFEHDSQVTKTPMSFSTYTPDGDVKNAIIWLSGLTCSEENFITKAGVQKELSGTDTMIICPDTSPRGLSLVGEHEAFDFGSGAGFYVNATTEGYKNHYKMYDYILEEIGPLLKSKFSVQKISIMGHSMGGHGALILGLKNPTIFSSVSAFSPIVNPSLCPWGVKAFNGYLGKERESWKEYDTCELLKSGVTRKDTLFIDQGSADDFLKEQLLTGNLEATAADCGQSVNIRYQEGHDHSYYFIQTFLKDHLDFHMLSF
jgi:S-formylglutathione hydrolase